LITSLTLTNFRNYQSASVDGLNDRFVILTGPNGSGKTNCLEAVSLLSPGRGLRGASVADLQSQTHTGQTWSIFAKIHHKDDVTNLGVGRDPQKPDKKIIRSNQNPIKNQQDLGDILRTLWLTPQMDGLFLQASSERRRFFDRLVAAFDPSHSGRMTRYEKAMRERLNLLKDDRKTPDTIWLDALENIMAETAIAIAASRIDILNQLQSHIDKQVWDHFPKSDLQLTGEIEQSVQNQSALMIEDKMKEKLRSMRAADGQTGRTNYGVHRTDLSVTYRDKNANASQCSTGEQKALLTGVILSHAMMVEARYAQAPLLLFDEMAAHFDTKRRDALLNILQNLNTQVWLSGQETSQFLGIEGQTQFLSIDQNKIDHQ
jgi:DNA replication and repair protein RecF